jgi:hypothetical protein
LGAAPPPGAGVAGRRLPVIWVLAVLASIRVFVYCTAFPFFNNVDELYHFDLVVKYAHGEFPTRLVPISQESARYIILYGTPEYFSGPEKFPNRKISPPTWIYPADQIAVALPIALANWKKDVNHEATEPPLYYAIAALWLRLGRLMGIEGGFLLYWIRFLNPLLAAALVWIGFFAARAAFPERPLIVLGVPALLAFFPQDTFYSIQSDVLSPIVFGLAFLGVLKWLRADSPRLSLAVFTGLALAAAGLVKGANWPLVIVAMLALLFHAARAARTGNAKQAMTASLVLTLCVALPLGAWLVRNAVVIGDLTGTAEKTRMLGWTRKPLIDWWRHPMFTPKGLAEFWTELMASFWRGEIVWFGQRMSSSVMDFVYWASSLVLVGFAAASLWPRRKNVTPSERHAVGLSIALFAGGIAFLAVTSLAFDFGACQYPSQAHPFFTSGRLMTGALVPFALLYVYGLDRAFAWTKSPWPAAIVLVAILFFVTVSEIEINSPAFASAYNWFGLWTGGSS